MKNELITVIVAVKNGERFIADALQSIIIQDYEPLEILVIDGKSTDRTIEIAKSFNSVQIIKQEKLGIPDAYNLGIEKAKGKFISFLSCDDIWIKDKLVTQISFMEKNPEIQFTNTLIEYFIEPGVGIPEGFRKEWLHGSHPARIMETLVARKEVFNKVGLFNCSLSTAEDVDWYSRAADLKIYSSMIQKVLLRKRIHGGNSSMKVNQNNRNLLSALRAAVERKKKNTK